MMHGTTARPKSFVVFSCDGWSVAGVFLCSTADELSEHLSSYWDFFDFPAGLHWGRVARRAFVGRVVFFSGEKSGGYLIIPSESVSFYRQAGGRLVQTEPEVYTLADLTAARFEDELEAEMGIEKSIAVEGGSIVLTKTAPSGVTEKRVLRS